MADILITGASGALGKQLCSVMHENSIGFRAASRTKPGLPYEFEFHKTDLDTGEGFEEALSGIKYIFHLASGTSRRNIKTDADKTEGLIYTAKKQKIIHFIYISIVGIDKIPYSYYTDKLETEKRIINSGLPYTIFRATQFHEFIDLVFTKLTRFPFGLIPKAFKIQPVEAKAVARELLNIYRSEPLNTIINKGGPEILTLGEMVKPWLKAKNKRKLILNFPWPGKTAVALKKGYNTCEETVSKSITWKQYLDIPQTY
jgi:uncharacterized protein YbjT (DUF2867 family)